MSDRSRGEAATQCGRSDRGRRRIARQKPARKLALVGLPNSGKSQVFNRLTGRYAVVANYPMTTVTSTRHPALIASQWYEVIDTPGLNGLTIHAEEELEVREILYVDRPDVVVQCIDANRLKSSLSLTADLLELELPLIVALTAIDETTRNGVEIDAPRFSQLLGVQVVELAAAKGLGLGELKRAITEARPGGHRKRYGDLLEEGIARVAGHLPAGTPYPRKTALTLLMGDPFLARELARWGSGIDSEALSTEVESFRRGFRANPATAASSVRNRWIDSIAEEVVRTRPSKWGRAARLAETVSRHPIFGAPVLLGLLALCFLLVVNVANRLADVMNARLWVPAARALGAWLPAGFWHDLLLGTHGIVSFGLANALLTVLPILSVFFLAYGVIEDSGYIPNAAVMTRRALRRLGLSGGAVMPLVLACGCKTMATMATKMIPSRRERIIAVSLIASSIPCAAQTGINLAILGRTAAWSIALVGAVTIGGFIGAGALLHRLLKEDQPAYFIQALPPMRMPSPRAVLVKTYYRLVWFCREAVPVFVAAAVILFAAETLGLLGALRAGLAPLVEGFLGLPSEMVDVLVLCFARQEAAAGMLLSLVEQGRLDAVQTVVAVVLALRFVPCFNTVVAMVKELGLGSAAAAVVATNASAFLLAGAVRWGLAAAGM